jgi:phenylacetic acid degradation operon negative regulatory protein
MMSFLMTTLSPSPLPLKVAKLQRGLILRANSLLVTLYGDALAAQQAPISLGSLIELGGLFGLSPRLVRTSAFRLTADSWFDVTRMGRRSFYGLSALGQQRVVHAQRRIYDFAALPWDGYWTLALVDARLKASTRQHLKRELLWAGFGQLSGNVFAHPHADHATLQDIIASTQTRDQLVVLKAQSIDGYAAHPLATVMQDTFKLAAVGQAWQQFMTRFAPLQTDAPALSPTAAFFARTLLIHEYRKVLLRDPQLPAELLPADWPGGQARQLCEALYRSLAASSNAYLAEKVICTDAA